MTVCEFCRTNLFENDDWRRGQFHQHHTQAEEWEKSLKESCTICTNLLRAVRDGILQITGEANSLLLEAFLEYGIIRSIQLPLYDVCMYESAGRDQFELDFRPLAKHVEAMRYSTPLREVKDIPLQTITFIIYSVNYDTPNHTYEFEETSNTLDAFPQIEKWLERCKKHKLCPSLGTQTKFIPSRLLELGKPDTNGEFEDWVKLVDTREYEDKQKFARYATLSHCWGAFVKLQLKGYRLEEFKKRIGLEEFPRNFQNAIYAARKLGIGYVWIDSLCIMQDNSKDWEEQAKLMHEVYGHSYLNLAAASSKNCHEGFFRHRDIKKLAPSTVEIAWKGQKQLCKVVRKDFWTSELITEPLYRRAWVLQERMLSPRTVNFGSRQLFWQCLGSTACESMPEGIPEVITDGGREELRWRAVMNRGDAKVTNNENLYLNEIWRHVVNTYMSCRITVVSDKFPALEGLVSKLKDVTKEEYYYGVWKSDMVQQLAWKVKDCMTADMTPAARYVGDEYVCPTWLWSSVNGMIEAPKRVKLPEGRYLLGDKPGSVGTPQFTPTEKKPMALDAGYLDVKGEVFELTFKSHGDDWDAELGNQAWCKLFPDEPFNKKYDGWSGDTVKTAVLPLYYVKDAQGVRGRALTIHKVKDSKENEYMRSGLVIFRDLGKEQWKEFRKTAHESNDKIIRLI